MRTWFFGLVLALAPLGCGGSDHDVLFDIGVPDFNVPSGCAALSQCLAFCSADAGTACETKCRADATQAALTAYDAIGTCVTETCSAATDDGGVSICSDPSSIECMRCTTNSRYKTPSECADAPAYCGACSTQQAMCSDS